MMLNPYGWAAIRSCNTLDDLRRAAPQSRAAIARRIVYETEISQEIIMAYLHECQSKITGAIQSIKV